MCVNTLIKVYEYMRIMNIYCDMYIENFIWGHINQPPK